MYWEPFFETALSVLALMEPYAFNSVVPFFECMRLPVQVTQTVTVPAVPDDPSSQITNAYREELTHQQYRIVGKHSAVKVCGWTKNMLRGEGGCYKLKFYGIQSHKCMQMSTNMSCANRCTFCWRGDKAPVAKKWEWAVDDPDLIIEESIKAHHKLLEGFKGNEKVTPNMYDASKTVGHVALSLIGEPIMYPKINALCKKFHARKISTFIVTNAQYPASIRKLKTITQLYLSLDAPNPDTLKLIDKPLFIDYWKRYLKSIDEAAKKKYRTTARLTVVSGVNDIEPENYAKLIVRGDFDFVEVKGYVHVGESRKHHTRDQMPEHERVKNFALKVLEYLPEYELCSEHHPSKVVLIAKKQFHKKTWIDFNQFFMLVNVKKPPANLDAMAYTVGTQQVKESAKDEGVMQ